MITVDTKEMKKYENTLKAFKERAIPYATRNTINSAAFNARSEAQKEIRDNMITRNKWSERSVRVERSRTLNINRQESAVGSVAGYMETQEFGGMKRSTGTEGVAIATSYSAGLGENARPRTKLPRKPNKLENIQLRKNRRRAKNKKQAFLFKVQNAVKTGDRIIYHEFDRDSRGIFKVVGGRKNFKRGWPRGADLKMLWDMSESTVRIPKNPWLFPAVQRTRRKLPELYFKSLKFQIEKHSLSRKI